MNELLMFGMVELERNSEFITAVFVSNVFVNYLVISILFLFFFIENQF